ETRWREYLTILDEELDRLPERFRAPLVMCYFEGLTRDEAARLVGWSLRTFDRRVRQGRGVLRGRLVRRGVTLGAALFPAYLGEQAALATLPPSLIESATKAGLCGAGSTVAEVPVPIVALAKGIETPVRWSIVGLVVVTGMAVALVGAAGYRLANVGGQSPPGPEQAPTETEAHSGNPGTHQSNDRLPEG